MDIMVEDIKNRRGAQGESLKINFKLIFLLAVFLVTS